MQKPKRRGGRCARPLRRTETQKLRKGDRKHPNAGATRGHSGLAAAKIFRRGTPQSFQTGSLPIKNYLMLWGDVIMELCDSTPEELFGPN
jgi:hypothetical protein